MKHSNEQGKVHPAVAAVIVIILVGIVATVAIAVQPTTEEASQSTNAPATSNQESTGTNSTMDEYRDGTYSATGTYVTPGGTQSIDLTVTIENGVIVATELAENATDRDSRQYQAAFASGYSELVVGKEVDEVSVSRVSGSSLTSNGFNRALEQIKDAAA